MNAPILDLPTCIDLARAWRQQGQSIVFTNGHFDLMHAGHVHYLQAARAMGDRLIVGMNDDASTRRRKGPTRPILPQGERALLLSALRAVDAVIVWDKDDFREVVAALQPDIYVKGSDWNRAGGPLPPEAEIVEGYGGRVAYVELTPGLSTSAIVQKILAQHGCEQEDAS